MSCCADGGSDCQPARDVHADVKEYYGKTLTSTASLKTDACETCDDRPSPRVRAVLADIHEEVASKYYGCGLVYPEEIDGCRVLDLGCGAGRDVYLLSALVGPRGHVTGVDMTPEQLDVARRHVDYHREKFGFDKANVSFVQATLEDLDKAIEEDVLQEASFDVIISNCVINLVKDKKRVLAHALRLLKPGGEMYDVTGDFLALKSCIGTSRTFTQIAVFRFHFSKIL